MTGKPRWGIPIVVLVSGGVLLLIGLGFNLGEYVVRDNAGLDPVYAPAWTGVLICVGFVIAAVGWIWLVAMGFKYRKTSTPR